MEPFDYPKQAPVKPRIPGVRVVKHFGDSETNKKANEEKNKKESEEMAAKAAV